MKNEFEENQCNNAVANVLIVIAWIIYIVGLLNGCIDASSEDEFVWSVAWSCWKSAFISGTMFLGFAEIIKLLEAIKNK